MTRFLAIHETPDGCKLFPMKAAFAKLMVRLYDTVLSDDIYDLMKDAYLKQGEVTLNSLHGIETVKEFLAYMLLSDSDTSYGREDAVNYCNILDLPDVTKEYNTKGSFVSANDMISLIQNSKYANTSIIDVVKAANEMNKQTVERIYQTSSSSPNIDAPVWE